MKLRISRDIDKYIIYFTFVEILILRWILIGQDTILMCTCIFLCLRLAYLGKKKTARYRKILLFFIPILAYIVVLSIASHRFDRSVFLSNLYYMALPAIWISYFGYLLSSRRELIKECFENIRPVLNVYYFINFIVILLQRGGTYFLMPVDRIENIYYQDHLAGLLGIDGTHRLALFTVFIVLLNIRYLMINARNHKVKYGTAIYTVFIIVTAFYTSALNDNNMLFLLLPVFILAFYMFTPGSSRGKIFNTILIAFTIFVVLYFVSSSSYIADILGARIDRVLNNVLETIGGSQTADERMIYLVYAFSQLNGWFLGSGFGALQMRQDPAIVALGYNYRNWGMSDISPFVAMGGLIFYIGVLLFYSNVLFSNKSGNRERKYSLVFMFIMTYYHQVLTHSTMTIPMCWILCLFALQRDIAVKNIFPKRIKED